MDQPVSYPATTGPDLIVVVGSQFCTPQPIDIVIQRKLLSLKECNFVVTDINGNILFQIKGKLFSLHDRRLILDAAGNPILTLHQKIRTAHRRWAVFRGDETESKNLLFSVKKSSLIQFKTELDVFMAANTEEQACDFKISGSWLDRSCVIYAGNAKNMVIAQMQKMHSVQSVVLGQDTYSVTVCPNVDYAFIAALVAENSILAGTVPNYTPSLLSIQHHHYLMTLMNHHTKLYTKISQQLCGCQNHKEFRHILPPIIHIVRRRSNPDNKWILAEE